MRIPFWAAWRERVKIQRRIDWLSWVLVDTNAIRDHLHPETDGLITCGTCIYRWDTLQGLLKRRGGKR